jgi:hypothetical protein
MLVNSLVGIKAKPGWLIVVSGHTDNTGNPQLNQMLSLKRAGGAQLDARHRRPVKAVLRCRAMAKASCNHQRHPGRACAQPPCRNQSGAAGERLSATRQTPRRHQDDGASQQWRVIPWQFLFIFG